MKHIIRFNVQVTNNISFLLEIDIEELNSRSVIGLALDKALWMKSNHGYFSDIELTESIFFNKIVFAWQGWID